MPTTYETLIKPISSSSSAVAEPEAETIAETIMPAASVREERPVVITVRPNSPIQLCSSAGTAPSRDADRPLRRLLAADAVLSVIGVVLTAAILPECTLLQAIEVGVLSVNVAFWSVVAVGGVVVMVLDRKRAVGV